MIFWREWLAFARNRESYCPHIWVSLSSSFFWLAIGGLADATRNVGCRQWPLGHVFLLGQPFRDLSQWPSTYVVFPLSISTAGQFSHSSSRCYRDGMKKKQKQQPIDPATLARRQPPATSRCTLAQSGRSRLSIAAWNAVGFGKHSTRFCLPRMDGIESAQQPPSYCSSEIFC